MVRYCKPLKIDNFNMLYKNICGVFCAKTSHTHTHTHTHTEDIRELFYLKESYILWKWHFTTPSGLEQRSHHNGH